VTLAEIKNQVQNCFTTEQVQESFGDLRKRETWEAALDKCQEFIVAARDAIESAQGQAVIAAAQTTIAKAALLAMDAAIWVVKTTIVAVLVILELSQEGTIERLTGRAQTTAETVRRKYSEVDFKDLRAFQIRNMAIAEGIATTNPETGATYGKPFLTAKLLEVPT
jgi:hypothetical protein